MGLSASGLATGLDINSMVNQLVQAERAPRQKSIDNKLAEVETHISAYGRLKESLDSMKQLMSDFRSDGNFAARKTTTSDEDTLTGEASKDAAPGNYSIEVLKLASAHKLVSSPFAENQVFGAGKLEISLGNRSMSIDVTDPNAKLEDVVTAINSAPSNPGVQASLIQDENGTRLTFSSDKQGDKNHIKVSVNAGIGSPYQQLVFDAGAVSNPMQQMQAASDAQIRIDGLVVANSSTNTFSDVIKGVDLTVENLTVNKPVKFNVDFDKEAVKGALKKFVDAYNGYYELSKNLSRYDQENQQAAPLTGDSTLRSATSQLRRLFASPLEDVTSSFKTLSEIGISTTREAIWKLTTICSPSSFSKISLTSRRSLPVRMVLRRNLKTSSIISLAIQVQSRIAKTH